MVILRQKSELLVTYFISGSASAIGGKYRRFFAVTSSGDWEVTNSDAWCSVTPQSGNAGFMRLTLKVDANNAKDARQATLTFTLKDKPEIKKEVTVKQDGASISIYSSEGYTFPAEGETKEKYFRRLLHKSSLPCNSLFGRFFCTYTSRFLSKITHSDLP